MTRTRKQQHDTGYAPLYPYFALTPGSVIAEGELVVDNFAGGGGASKGLELALGRPVDIAVNHDPEAVAMHQVNHPHTQHFCESVWEVDPVQITAGRKVALAWFSPDCKHFSKAKGGKPVSKEIRGLAWVALRWAATVRPRVIVVENVEEFKTWGPLAEDGRPCPRQSGRTFNSWVNALKFHGYNVQWRELVAYEYGAPTSRKRLFIVARCDGQPIIWPAKTHGKPTDPRVKSGELQPWRTAADCIDWSIPIPSVFGRKRPLAQKTNERIAQGLLRFTLNASEPFIVTCNHAGGFRGQATTEPMRTITAAYDAHGPVAAQLTTYYGQKRPGEVRGRRPDEPVATQTSGGNRHALTAARLTKVGGAIVGCGGRAAQAMPRGLNSTIGTQTAKADRCLAAAHLIKIDNQRSRTSGTASLELPNGTEVTKASRALIAAQLVRHNGGFCQPQHASRSLNSPNPTITAQGGPQSLTTAQLIKYNNKAPARLPSKPFDAMTTKPRFGFSLATAQIIRQFNKGIGHAMTDPHRTVMTDGGGGKSLLLLAETAHELGLTSEQLSGARQVYAFLSEHLGSKLDPHTDHEHQLVFVHLHDETYVITDIGMRMLEPRELYRAQGFPDDYIIDFSIKGKPLSKAAQVRMCGNAVPPPFSRAIAHANLAIPMQEAAD